MAQCCDAVHRNLVPKQEMVQYSEHHHGVEMAGAAVQEGGVFTVLPSGSGRRMSEINAQRKDILATAFQARAKAIDSLHVGVDRNHLSTSVSGQIGVNTRIATYVEHLAGRAAPS